MSDQKMLVDLYAITDDLASDWIKIRKGKGAKALTETMLKRFEAQCEKAGYTPAQAIEICVIEEWRGFNSEWRGKHMNEWPKSSKLELDIQENETDEERAKRNKLAVRRALRDINDTSW